MKKTLVTTAISLLLLVSCDNRTKNEKQTTTEPQTTLHQVLVTDNISYREGNPKWVLDLAQPLNFGEEPHPAIVIIHGGGWRAGDKQVNVYTELLLNYARQGYVTLSVAYRLDQEGAFPACIEDVKCAVRWLRAHAKEYHVDPNRIGAYGHSAGAHLALMLAVSFKNKQLDGNDAPWEEYSSGLTCVAAGSPPTEIGNPNSPWAKHPEWWPIGYISGDQPPIFLIQGGKDPVVKPERTQDYYDKMKAAGANIEMLFLPEGHHGVAYEQFLNQTKPAMDKFFAKYLKP